ncbi:MAG: preprotein translocase subunit SecG [Lachnospiraceae bacterium]|nr:preprotein translocase subunit SecG [Lachnospiraceae bacterium]
METLKTVLMILFIIVSIVITIIILSQEGKSAGLGSLGGQTTETYYTKNKGRTKEGFLVKLTSCLVIVFFVLAAILNIGSF